MRTLLPLVLALALSALPLRAAAQDAPPEEAETAESTPEPEEPEEPEEPWEGAWFWMAIGAVVVGIVLAVVVDVTTDDPAPSTAGSAGGLTLRF